MTSCLSHVITHHCEQNLSHTEQQKGCMKNTQGCKERLIIDSLVMSQGSKNNGNVHTAYIDYKKALTSVSHSCLIEVMKI